MHAAIEVERDIGTSRSFPSDVSQIGAAVKLANLAHTTQDVGGDAAVVVSGIGTAEYLAINLVTARIGQRGVARIRHGEVDGIDVALSVGAAIDLVDKAGIDRGAGRAENVGSRF